MSKSPASGRAMRLECIKVAANIVVQLKDQKMSVVALAKQLMDFVDGTTDETDRNEDAENLDIEDAPAQQRRYTMRDLRRRG